MTFEKAYDIHNNQLVINLPEKFKTRKRVKVIIEDIDEERELKIEMLKKATKDPLFLADIADVNSDFEYSDRELL
jgi:hypothetical protein